MEATPGVSIEDVRQSLRSLSRECQSQTTFQSVVGYLIYTFRRIMALSKSDYVNRRLMKADEEFRRNVWRWKAGREFLEASGWIEVSESLFLPNYVDLSEVCALLERNLDTARCFTSSTASSLARPRSQNSSSNQRSASSSSALFQSTRHKQGLLATMGNKEDDDDDEGNNASACSVRRYSARVQSRGG